jgi:hypothetical protein
MCSLFKRLVQIWTNQIEMKRRICLFALKANRNCSLLLLQCYVLTLQTYSQKYLGPQPAYLVKPRCEIVLPEL